MNPRMYPAENANSDFEELQYFYHPDHASTSLSTSLGSANYITDRDGNAVQHMLYLPFGEQFVSEETGDFDSRYKFSGKELDNETGYNYFGARYYDSDLSNWLSVDPMSDSRPNVSPFNYCQWNPIVRIDSFGRLDTKYVDETGATLYETNDGLKNIIIISDGNKKKFEDKFNKLNQENKLNDPNVNKKYLYSFGTDIFDYSKQYETGNSNHDVGFPIGYEKTYKGEATIGTDIFYFFLSSFGTEGAEIGGGYLRGKDQGGFDRKHGRINMLNPSESLKNNRPLIKLKSINK